MLTLMNHNPLPIPQGYRRLKRLGIAVLPGDLKQSLCFKPPYFWYAALSATDRLDHPIYYEHTIYARPICRKAQRKTACCAHCGRTHERVGSGYRYESHERNVHLLEVSPGRLVCSRCTSDAKRAVTRHFNLVRRLGGMPTYEGQRVSAAEAGKRHIQATLS